MEEEILRSQSSDESIGDITGCSWVGIEGHEARQCLSVLHTRDTSAFELLLSKQGTDLSLVDDATFSTSLHHSRDHVLGEALDETAWDALFQGSASSLSHG